MCQQEQEQSLASILGENTDKMQLTRKILDLKQVGDSRQQTQKLLLNTQQASIIIAGKHLDFFLENCIIVQCSTIVYLYVSKCLWFKMQSERLRSSAYAHIGRYSLYLLTDVTDSLASLKATDTASSTSRVGGRGLHGLKTEARTRDRLSQPDPSGTVKFRARTQPEITPPTTNSQQKKRKKAAFHDCMQRNRLIKALLFHKHLPVMKVCEHQVQRSHTFCRVYEFCMDKKIILPPCKLWSFFVS